MFAIETDSFVLRYGFAGLGAFLPPGLECAASLIDIARVSAYIEPDKAGGTLPRFDAEL
jgi:hypothetical protein